MPQQDWGFAAHYARHYACNKTIGSLSNKISDKKSSRYVGQSNNSARASHLFCTFPCYATRLQLENA